MFRQSKETSLPLVLRVVKGFGHPQNKAGEVMLSIVATKCHAAPKSGQERKRKPMYTIRALPRRRLFSAAFAGLLAAFSFHPEATFASTHASRLEGVPEATFASTHAPRLEGAEVERRENPQGSWDVTVTFVDGPRQGASETVQAFLGPSTFASTSTSDPTSFVLAGWGQWSRTGPQHFIYDIHEVTLDSVGEILNLVYVHGLARLSHDGASFDAWAEGKVYGRDGHLLAVSHSSSHAVRRA